MNFLTKIKSLFSFTKTKKEPLSKAPRRTIRVTVQTMEIPMEMAEAQVQKQAKPSVKKINHVAVNEISEALGKFSGGDIRDLF